MKISIGLLTLLLASSAYAQDLPLTFKCINDQKQSFTLTNLGNLRNQADAQITEISPNLDFKGVWAWLTSVQKGVYSSLYEYQLSGGKLSIAEQVIYGRGGCGRGFCDNKQKMTSAKFIENETFQEIDFYCY